MRLDLFESLPSRRVCCRASTTNSTAKSRSTVLYICIALCRAGCRALQLYSAPQLYSSTALQLSTLYTLPQAEAPRLGQDWSPCAASVVICGGHFLLPIHVSHSTASRGGTSEPQRVPTRPPASRSGGVSLLIRYHVEQVEGGPFRARAALSPAPLRGLHVAAAAQDPSDLEFFTLSTAPQLRRAHPSPGLGLLIPASRSAHL